MQVFNFSGIPAASRIGRALRHILRLVPKGAVVRVLQGPARGSRWVVGAQTHGMWLGSYERDVQAALCREVKPGHVFFDVGANVGFYTVIASRLVGSGRVIAFEPLPGNLDILRRHIALNHLSNVTIVPKALADSVGKARFSTTNDCSMNRLDPGGELEVEVTTVDGALAAGGIPPPDVLKVDVEGAELAMLRGAAACLRTYRPLLFVAVHSDRLYAGVHRFIRDEDLPYAVTTLSGEAAPEDRFVEEIVLRPVAR